MKKTLIIAIFASITFVTKAQSNAPQKSEVVKSVENKEVVGNIESDDKPKTAEEKKEKKACCSSKKSNAKSCEKKEEKKACCNDKKNKKSCDKKEEVKKEETK